MFDYIGFLADLIHIFANVNLLWRMWAAKSCAGVSEKSQQLFAIVCTVKYLHIFVQFSLEYILQVLLIILTSYACLLVTRYFRNTRDGSLDTFRIKPLVIASFLTAVVIGARFDQIQKLMTFGVVLETVAGVPQLYMLAKTGPPSRIVRDYLFGMTASRVMYIVDALYRAFVTDSLDLTLFVPWCFQATLFWSFLVTSYWKPKSTTEETGACQTTIYSNPGSYYRRLIENLADIIYVADCKQYTLNELHKKLNKRGIHVLNDELKNIGFKNFKMLMEDQPWLVLFDKGGSWYVRRRFNGETRPARPLVDANRRQTKNETEGELGDDTFIDPYQI